MRYRRYLTEGFATPTGLVEISSENFEKHGYNPLPEYREPLLMEIESENCMEINTADARNLGIQDGDYAEVESPQAKAAIKVKVREGVRPGVVCVRHGHGFGHWGLGSVAKGKGTYINTLLDTSVNPISGGTALCECKVKIRRV